MADSGKVDTDSRAAGRSARGGTNDTATADTAAKRPARGGQADRAAAHTARQGGQDNDGGDGTVMIEVVVGHDQLRRGERGEVPLTDLVRGRIDRGYLRVIDDPDATVPVSTPRGGNRLRGLDGAQPAGADGAPPRVLPGGAGTTATAATAATATAAGAGAA